MNAPAVYGIEVGVALSRPPRHDATVYVQVVAPSRTAARLLACLIAAAHPLVVMPVSDQVMTTTWRTGGSS